MPATLQKQHFHGAKIALISEGQILTVLRDDLDHIPHPNCWDLPGGGAEAGETPLQCVLRETREEVGLRVLTPSICWARPFVMPPEPARGWFFVAEVSREFLASARLGSEGQQCETMAIVEFLALDNAVPYLQSRLRLFLDAHA